MINEDIKPLELTYSLLKRIFAVIYETRTPNDKPAPACWLKWSQFTRIKPVEEAASLVIQYSFELIFYCQNFVVFQKHIYSVVSIILNFACSKVKEPQSNCN